MIYVLIHNYALFLGFLLYIANGMDNFVKAECCTQADNESKASLRRWLFSSPHNNTLNIATQTLQRFA